jgi:hypothetical protein
LRNTYPSTRVCVTRAPSSARRAAVLNRRVTTDWLARKLRSVLEEERPTPSVSVDDGLPRPGTDVSPRREASVHGEAITVRREVEHALVQRPRPWVFCQGSTLHSPAVEARGYARTGPTSLTSCANSTGTQTHILNPCVGDHQHGLTRPPRPGSLLTGRRVPSAAKRRSRLIRPALRTQPGHGKDRCAAARCAAPDLPN